MTDPDEREATWAIAWERFAAGLGPCPIPEQRLAQAVADYPDRTTYPLALASWQEAHRG